MSMLDRLSDVEKRFCFLQGELEKPDVAHSDETVAIYRELKTLTPIVTEYSNYKKLAAELSDARELFAAENDGEMREMIRAEIAALSEAIEKSEAALKLLLLPRDPNDEKNVVIEIRAGAGGEEAALFAAVLFRMYKMYADRVGWKVDVVSENATELGGYREITFCVAGEGAYSRLKFESGVHRVQRVPVTEAQGRIQTSTVTVAVLPEAEAVEIEIKDSDLKIETIKSSGAGGQHVNKTESAIRLLHIPTGIVIDCQDERSQYKNRDKAMKILRAKLYDLKSREQNDRIASERRVQIGTGDRSEKIRTYNYPQGRITDHRIGFSVYSLEGFLNGEIQGMLDALMTADAAERLKGTSES